MAITNSAAIIIARKWLKKQKNIPEKYSLGKLGNNKETGGKKFSIRLADTKNPKGKFITILVFVVTDDKVTIIEDYREKYQHIWS